MTSDALRPSLARALTPQPAQLAPNTDIGIISLRGPSRRRIETDVTAVTKGWLLGTECGSQAVLRDIPTTPAILDSLMAAAMRRAEEAFLTYASGSKRALSLGVQSSPEEWALHRRTYIGSCNTAKAVNRFVEAAALFFAHCNSNCGGFLHARESQVAARVCAYAKRGKTTVRIAKAALRWVEAATGEMVFASSFPARCMSQPPCKGTRRRH